jgi:hypothetical protein
MEISFFTRHVLDSRHVQLKKSKAEELNDMGQPWLIHDKLIEYMSFLIAV